MAITRLGGANAITGTIPNSVLAAGNVIQVIQVERATELSTTSTSLVDVGLSASITPSSSSNKVLVIVDAQGQFGSNTGWGNTIVRGSTGIFQTNNYSNYDSGATQTNTRASYCYLDSPSTTSATTYKLQVRVYNPGTVLMNEGGNPTTMTLMEIAG